MKRIIAGVLLAMLLLAGCQKAQPAETTGSTGNLSDLLQDYADTLTTPTP